LALQFDMQARKTVMAETARLAAGGGMAHRAAAWCGLLCLLWCTAATALSTDANIHDLRRTEWGPNEGAPNAIVALAQTSDGYLWIGNSSGLFRFDGLRFEHIDLPRDDRLSSVNVWSLFAPPSGGLWIGFTFGGAAFLKDGKLTAYAERDGLPPGSVKAIAQGQDGTLWAGTTSGLARLDGSRWEQVGREQGYTATQVNVLLVDSAGTLWAASRNKTLFLRRGEKAFRELDVQSQGDDAMGLAESATGEVWLSNRTVLRQLQKNENAGRRASSTGWKMLFDQDGGLWDIGIDSLKRIARPDELGNWSWAWAKDSLASYSDNHFTSGRGGSPAILEDREGNIWVAVDTGLDRYSERNVLHVLPPARDGETEFGAYSATFAAGDRGALWVAGRYLAPFILQDADGKRHDEIGGVSCAFRADDGAVWFGGNKGVWKYSSGRFTHMALPEGSDDFEVQAMAQDRLGRLWVSIVRKGVYLLADGVWTAYGGIASLPKLTAITLATDAQGRVWFGYTDGRVAILDGASVSFYSEQRRAPVGNVTAVFGKRTRVWVGGEFGLALFDGSRFQAVTPATAGAFNNVTGIVETDNGDVWINSRSGLVHLTAAETRLAAADPAYRAHGEVFDASDGVRGNSARLRPLPSAIEGTDGRLWFLTNVGLYSVDPARIVRKPLPPPVLIQSLTVDDKSYVPTGELKLPQRTTSVRIDYVAVSLAMAEKIRYRYRLDGVDKSWQEVQGRRQAYYTNLGPGPHRFHVVAANSDGLWNHPEATLDFVIAPTFVQTGWFIALCAVGGGLVAWMLIRIRVRQVAARVRGRLDERMAERERIARELHDTLLQSTQGLILRFQAVANRIPREDATREMLDKALDRADEVLAEGRDRVLDLRVPVDTLNDLPKALAAAGEELAEGREVTFRTIVDGTPHGLVRSVKDEAYRIGREALINAFAHSEAGTIEVQIIYADADVRVRVRDDGRGMDADAIEVAPRPGHWGMKGMRERAEKIGAQLDIWSRHGAGTEIELRIPASVAYRERGVLARWRRWARLG
jgi:signal transduction histidine kinase/ligand-binding sensor domain-containing protein